MSMEKGKKVGKISEGKNYTVYIYWSSFTQPVTMWIVKTSSVTCRNSNVLGMTAVHNREVTLSPTTVGIYTYAIYKEKKKQKQNLALPIKNKEWCLVLYSFYTYTVHQASVVTW